MRIFFYLQKNVSYSVVRIEVLLDHYIVKTHVIVTQLYASHDIHSCYNRLFEI